MTLNRTLLVILTAVTIVGCSGRIATSVAQSCSEELALAEAELERAKADGFGDAMSITKAASLTAAAAVQKQFEKYEGCIDKSRRARAYIGDVKRN